MVTGECWLCYTNTRVNSELISRLTHRYTENKRTVVNGRQSLPSGDFHRSFAFLFLIL